jgi:hypothetical protein
MSASGLPKSALELEERGVLDLRDKLIAASEERLLMLQETLLVATDEEPILRALAGIEVCKIVIEAVSRTNT